MAKAGRNETKKDSDRPLDLAREEMGSRKALSPTLPYMRTVAVLDKTLAGRISLPDPRQRFEGHPILFLEPGINILVGPNGSGKSSFLKSFEESKHGTRNFVVPVPKAKGVRFFAPPKELVSDITTPYLLDGPYQSLQMGKLYRSHGQGSGDILPLLIDKVTEQTLSEGGKSGLLIGLDEPEGFGLDAQGLMKVVDAVKRAVEKGIQFAIASHHPFFLLDKSFNCVVFGSDAKYVGKTRAIWSENLSKLDTVPISKKKNP